MLISTSICCAATKILQLKPTKSMEERSKSSSGMPRPNGPVPGHWLHE